jgi:protein-S-isoprenylcysteine O-methyltransferase Ste14
MQVALVGGITAAGLLGARWPVPARGLRMAAATASGLAGLYLFAGGIRGLAGQITPFPKPIEDGGLRQDGAYGLVRHPMYGGALLVTLGWSLVSSPVALAPWAVAAVFLDAKRRREEAWLEEVHPDYEQYREYVPNSLVPFVW